jgi:hypothetical protein
MPVVLLLFTKKNPGLYYTNHIVFLCSHDDFSCTDFQGPEECYPLCFGMPPLLVSFLSAEF